MLCVIGSASSRAWDGTCSGDRWLKAMESTHVSSTSNCLTSSDILSREEIHNRRGRIRVWVGAMRTGISSRSATDNEGGRCVELGTRRARTTDQYPCPKSRH